MLGFSKKTHAELMRTELGESWDHFLAAATHAANGVGKSMGPPAHRMRDVATRGWDSTTHALSPLAAAYREGAADATAAALKLKKKAKRARKEKDVSNNRMGMLVGLLVVGAAVGAAGALVMRRRKRQHWSEYDPSEALDSMSSDARSMVDSAAGRGGSTMDKVSHRAGRAMEKAGDKLHSAASSMRKSDYRSEFQAKADDTAEVINDATDDMRSHLRP